MSKVLIRVDNLVKHFTLATSNPFVREKPVVRAVDGVSFTVGEGETLGLVGESGCGKSTVGRLILNLLSATSGAVNFDGRDILSMDPASMRRVREDLQIIFQDPHASLNPRMTVEEIILEPLYAQGHKRTPELRAYAAELLEMVGLPARFRNRHPHQFSGGQRQRIGIARAIAPKPKLVVCDEAVSALDVSVQAQVINLMQDLKEKMGMSYLFIGHDLAVVRHISDRIAVMYLGRIVEIARRDELFSRPMHPYTQALMAAIPVAHPRLRHKRDRVRGELPSPLSPPQGCHFHSRCPFAQDICRSETPQLRQMGDEHQASCHFAEDLPGRATAAK
ncbi:ABC transporter ATP-binding protein [Pararhizobium sp. IMCC21322]|uniref:ABC transporter ATP-binding protein n=1 Tax=Pararhizobium sp. IMCC21322 TaxID=3067903 RepID=UPI002740DE9D|nr:oligopeptide/dipeptide ABC transporter ATP-binding protein [Pararhizobium sp. IMCC21322]